MDLIFRSSFFILINILLNRNIYRMYWKKFLLLITIIKKENNYRLLLDIISSFSSPPLNNNNNVFKVIDNIKINTQALINSNNIRIFIILI